MDTRLSVVVGPDAVTFEIKEKTKNVPHVLTQAEIAEEERRRRRNERWARDRVDWNNTETFAPGPPKHDIVRTVRQPPEEGAARRLPPSLEEIAQHAGTVHNNPRTLETAPL